MTQDFLNHQFLIAMPMLADTNFSHTVTYLCQHNEEGALGIVINRPAGLTLEMIFGQMDIETQSEEIANTPVYAGGPVQQQRGFIIHTGPGTWEATVPVSDETYLTSSRDILEAIAAGEGPEHYLVALGYAGWGEGQLEKEIADNTWLNTDYDHKILFDIAPKQRWIAAASKLGVDINKLTTPAGHA
jgi:putative transcriptional regulator